MYSLSRLRTTCERIDTVAKRENKNRRRALVLTATFTCSRSKSIMQIAQSQESMQKSREGMDSSVVRVKLSSRCHVATKTRRVNRCSVSASGKTAFLRRCSRFSDCLSGSFVTYLFIPLYGLYQRSRTTRKREINVRARYLDYVVPCYFITLRL